MPAAFRLFHFCLYLVFRFCEGLVRLFPLDFVFVAGRAGGEFAYRFLPRRRAIALGNLRLAFGADMSEAQLRALNREHF
ncbi:MAG: LpxL/LpxP family acyltransferase, partial [Chthoniobacterales bacterium]